MFIDNDYDDLYLQSAKELKEAQLIGIDSEFSMTYTKFDESSVSIL